MKFRKSQTGLTIIEIMIALLLSLFLMGGVIAVYSTTKQTYRITENLSRVQENLRFSMDLLAKDVRMAGYMPCRYQANLSNILTGGGAVWWQDFFNTGLAGFEGGVSTFPASLPAVGTNPGDRVTGADAIAIFKGSEFESSVLAHDLGARSITLQRDIPSPAAIEEGEVVIVCDSFQATMLQISNSTPITNRIFYNETAANISPGNCTAGLGSPNTVVCGAPGSGQPYTFGSDAQVVKYSPVIYYIRESENTPGVKSLYREFFEAQLTAGVETATMRAEELLQGIETMQVRYGHDTDADGVANQYVIASALTAAQWPEVVAVQIGLIMVSGEELSTNVDTSTYNVAGTLISDSSTPAHPADRKHRQVVNTTITMRNRN